MKFLNWAFSHHAPEWVITGALLFSVLLFFTWIISVVYLASTGGPWVILLGVPILGFTWVAYKEFQDRDDG